MSSPRPFPAFPRPFSWSESPSGVTYGNHSEAHPEQDGMTLRDYFAAAALGGMLAHPRWPNGGESGLPASEEQCAAHWAYAMADAMLLERAK